MTSPPEPESIGEQGHAVGAIAKESGGERPAPPVRFGIVVEALGCSGEIGEVVRDPLEAELGDGNAVLVFGEGCALRASDEFERSLAPFCGPARFRSRGRERITEPDVDQVRRIELYLDRVVVDHRVRSVGQHSCPDPHDPEAELLEKPRKRAIVLETPTTAATDDLGEHGILIDRHRNPMEHVEVLERNGDEMGVLESGKRAEVENIGPFGTDPCQIRIDSRHEVGHTLARCASLRPSRIS